MGCIQASHRLSDCLITGLFCYRPLSIFTRCARKAAQLFAADRLDFFFFNAHARQGANLRIANSWGKKVEYKGWKINGQKNQMYPVQRALVDSVSSVCIRGQNFESVLHVTGLDHTNNAMKEQSRGSERRLETQLNYLTRMCCRGAYF